MELRKDYILDRWVIISQGRGARPQEFKERAVVSGGGACLFCPGQEQNTPSEIGRIEKDGRWRIRWFPNKFPAVDVSGEPHARTDNTFFTFASAYGQHELIVETPEHEKQLADLDVEQVKELLGAYGNRIFWLSKDKNIKYVLVFKNHGQKAGTSLVHSHTQVISSNQLPRVVREEVDAARQHGHCPYCFIIEIEKKSERRCFENEHFVAFAPYASRFNYEVWIFPKNHVKHILQFSDAQLSDLARILLQVLGRIKTLGADYNLFFHYAPDGSDLHFHVEITPRIALWGGFELASGTVINSVSPEDAAAFYRS